MKYFKVLPRPRQEGPGRLFPSRRRPHRVPWFVAFWPLLLPFLVLSGVLANTIVFSALAFASPLAQSSSIPGHLTYQQSLKEGQRSKANQGSFVRPTNDPAALKPSKNAPTTKPLPSAEPAKMHGQNYALDSSFVTNRPVSQTKTMPTPTVQSSSIPAGTTSLVFKGSDGRLEVQVPRGAFDAAHVSLSGNRTPLGGLILEITQISGHSAGSENVLGTYQIQVVDSQGNAVQGLVLHKPLTLVYHYQDWEMKDLSLDPSQIHLAWPEQLVAARAAKQSTSSLVTPMINDATAHTLTAQTLVPNGMLTLSGSSTIQTPGTPDLYEASGNSGQYSYQYPLNVVPGPDGFAPHIDTLLFEPEH